MLKELYSNNVLIPLKSNKAPAINHWSDFNLENKVPYQELEKFKRFGFICGFNGVEVIDVDNHFGDADELFQFIHDNYQLENFPIVKTIGGGYHIYIRSDFAKGNLKFAKRCIIENDESKHDIDENGNHTLNTHGEYTLILKKDKDENWCGESTLIESRGVGGYVACPPSNGYEVIDGDLNNIPLISEDDRYRLFSICIALNEVNKINDDSKSNSTTERPGDIYNNDTSNIEATKSILRNAGWKSRDDKYWTRPGKELKDGFSATFGRVGVNKFYVFSSNAGLFEDQKSYSMFAVKAICEFGGDYNACAKSLVPEGDGKQKSKKEVNQPPLQYPTEEQLPYIRIGCSYFKKIDYFDQYGNKHKEIEKWDRQTLIDDYGKNVVSIIDKYDKFVNIPSHDSYQEIIGNCFNMYNEINHKIKEGKFDTIKGFMEHIFGEQAEMGYDYLQIMWNNPTHLLPILCLVSKENETGKSTFGNFMSLIFGGNYSNIGSSELNSEFNGSYATSLVTMIDEGYINYKVIDKLKHMATTPILMLRQMRRDHVPIGFFCKFILCSNREKEFIIANKEDKRYWIRKIGKFENFDPNFLDKLKSEIPALLHFLTTKELYTKDESRMHFSAESIRTEALDNVIRNSVDLQTKDFVEIVLANMESNKVLSLQATPTMLKDKMFFNRHDITFTKIKEILTDHLGLKPSEKTVRFTYLNDIIDSFGRCYTIPIDVLKESAGVNYINEEFENPF